MDLPVDIGGMGDYAGRMIRSSLQALLEGDAQVAESVRDMDDEIDRMNRVAQTELIEGDSGSARYGPAGPAGHHHLAAIWSA